MNELYNIDSILDAIDDINTSSKEKLFHNKSSNLQDIKENNLRNDEISPITEKIILEAEKYSNRIKKKDLSLLHTSEDILILDNEYNERNLSTIDLEKIKLNIINDLYSSLNKKVKKNTLKVIVDLRTKMNDLEKEIQVLNINNIEKTPFQFNTNYNEEHLINEDHLEESRANPIDGHKDNLTGETIETLRLQNSLIKKIEKNEEGLRLKIVDLEQDITLLRKKRPNITHN